MRDIGPNILMCSQTISAKSLTFGYRRLACISMTSISMFLMIQIFPDSLQPSLSESLRLVPIAPTNSKYHYSEFLTNINSKSTSDQKQGVSRSTHFYKIDKGNFIDTLFPTRSYLCLSRFVRTGIPLGYV